MQSVCFRFSPAQREDITHIQTQTSREELLLNIFADILCNLAPHITVKNIDPNEFTFGFKTISGAKSFIIQIRCTLVKRSQHGPILFYYLLFICRNKSLVAIRQGAERVQNNNTTQHKQSQQRPNRRNNASSSLNIEIQ